MKLSNQKFSALVLAWYDKHGRKDLPWQKNITPYRVWISEIMLQQTQVATVIPYFQRFIKKFPTTKVLAQAPQDEILHLWTGLGYYARARNLHRSAQIIQEQFNGKFPNTLETLQTLPGIGRSTAGAILAISKNQRPPILDGNVKRVLCRLHTVEGWPGKTEVQKTLWELTTKYTPTKHTAKYTQAIMDLGATVCTRARPLCLECPLTKHCLAHAQDRTQDFPTRKPSKKLPTRHTRMLLLCNTLNEILLEKRAPGGLWGGLWSLPECPIDEKDISTWCKTYYPCSVEKITHQPAFRHTFSHFHLNIEPILVNIKDKINTVMDSDKKLWYNSKEKHLIGLAAPVKRLLEGNKS